MTFRFVHAADLHLDTPFRGLGSTAPHVRAALQDASLEAWDALVRLALERRAHALLVAGDVYDGAERGVRAQLRFLRGLERLSAGGVRVFVVHGNHDPLDGWSAVRAWPAGVHVFGPEPESVPIERDGRVVATVHGISYATRDTEEDLAARLRPSPAGGLQIGLVHATVGPAGEHATYAPTTLDTLRGVGIDYWALGHIHQRAVLSREPWVVYPGNVQGRSPKPAERGAKGALVIESSDGHIAREPEFVALDRARFIDVAVDVGALPSLPELRARLVDEAHQARADADARGLILSATLQGRGELHADLSRAGAVDALLRDLRDATAEFEPFVWWSMLRVRTSPLLDRESLRGRGDFAAEALARAEALAADPERLRSFLEARLHTLSGGRYARVVPELSLRDDAELLRDAEALALDRLLAQEE